MFFILWKMTKKTGEFVHKKSIHFCIFHTIYNSEERKDGTSVQTHPQKYFRKQFDLMNPLKVGKYAWEEKEKTPSGCSRPASSESPVILLKITVRHKKTAASDKNKRPLLLGQL
jgi:hypothetical protein